MKGTGKWTIQEAAEVLVAAPTISGSLNARFLSGIKDERVAASKSLFGPDKVPDVDKKLVCLLFLYFNHQCISYFLLVSNFIMYLLL